MLTALVLVCSVVATSDLRDCTPDNATVVMGVPGDFGNPATCFMHAQAYLAETWIGRELGENALEHYTEVKTVWMNLG